MAGVLTGGPAGAATRDTASALIGMRRTLARNSPGGSATVLTLRVVGLALAVGTLLLGLVRFDDPGRSVDLLATLTLGWLIGWVMGPIVVRGAGLGLRPEWFALVPIPPRRLAAGLLGASFAGFAPAVTLLAFGALAVAAGRLGVLPVLVTVPAMLLQLTVVVLASRVVVAALAATLSSRRGQELGGLLMAVVIALASGGWSLATVMGQQLAADPSPALSTALRVLPSGWGAVAVAAAGRSDWPVALGALGGLAVLSGLLLAAWAKLLPVTMRKPGGPAPRTLRGHPASAATAASHLGVWQRPPTGPTGAVLAKELHTWRRDPGRTLLLLLALLISGLNLAVPAVAFGTPAALPWVGLAAALIVSMGTANVYGDEGTALWLTRMVPGVERADVRGRQLAWLLVVAPVVVVPTVAFTAFSGQGWAWPWVLACLPAVLGGTAGLGMLLSVTRPVRQKDPNRRAGPFDTSHDPGAAGAVIGQQYLMLLLAALTVVPGATLVLLGGLRHQPLLQAAGVLVGAATGVLLYWWGGRTAARRLADRGAELMDLLHLGPQERTSRDQTRPARDPGPPMSRARSALHGTLLTAGILLIVPQGLVPIGFNLLGVDPGVKVWFAARYLPQELQLPVAAGFAAVGVLTLWWAETIRRRRAGLAQPAAPATAPDPAGGRG
jgi:ABC-2 type transport system permease protein